MWSGWSKGLVSQFSQKYFEHSEKQMSWWNLFVVCRKINTGNVNAFIIKWPLHHKQDVVKISHEVVSHVKMSGAILATTWLAPARGDHNFSWGSAVLFHLRHYTVQIHVPKCSQCTKRSIRIETQHGLVLFYSTDILLFFCPFPLIQWSGQIQSVPNATFKKRRLKWGKHRNKP